MEYPYLIEDRADYREVWLVPPPPIGVKYRVLEQRWDQDADPPIRYIQNVSLDE